MSDPTRIEFEAEIVLTDEEIAAAGEGGLEQAVQNEIGHVGAQLMRITHISEFGGQR